jgi:hypothetical protein
VKVLKAEADASAEIECCGWKCFGWKRLGGKLLVLAPINISSPNFMHGRSNKS